MRKKARQALEGLAPRWKTTSEQPAFPDVNLGWKASISHAQ